MARLARLAHLAGVGHCDLRSALHRRRPVFHGGDIGLRVAVSGSRVYCGGTRAVGMGKWSAVAIVVDVGLAGGSGRIR